LIEGLFAAYQAGRKQWVKSRGWAEADICCLWVDEFHVVTSSEREGFAQAHHAFIQKRCEKLLEKQPLQRAEIRPYVSINDAQEQDLKRKAIRQVSATLPDLMQTLHQHHAAVDPVTGKRVSFGIVRFANIAPMVEVAKQLFLQDAAENHHFYLCCYHSQHPLLMRSYLEKQLDQILNRKDPNAVFQHPTVRQMIEATPQENVVFVVLASPVAEVGRDHDYDWGIIEPSSMRSIIQLAGRIWRHRRHLVPETSNIFILEKNIRALRNKIPAYVYPGFERKNFKLISHELTDLLLPEQYQIINAIPRITQPHMPWQENLAALEHHALRCLLRPEETNEVTAWWETAGAQTGCLQQMTPFRKSRPQQRIFLGQDDNGKLCAYEAERYAENPLGATVTLVQQRLQYSATVTPWPFTQDYLGQLELCAQERRLSPEQCAVRFGWTDLYINKGGAGWCYEPTLGFQWIP
jgi:CRISPR-associated endonuclease/helicase Cas3